MVTNWHPLPRAGEGRGEGRTLSRERERAGVRATRDIGSAVGVPLRGCSGMNSRTLYVVIIILFVTYVTYCYV